MIAELLVLTTGGTIDKVYFDAKSIYQVGEPVVAAVLHAMHVAVRLELVSVCRKDSLELTDEDRRQLREAILGRPQRHVLITHGTDTLTDTAAYLADIRDRHIVLTGAMQPAAFRETDAIFNLGTAMGVLASAPPGVYIAMNGQAFPAGTAIKNHAQQRFELKGAQ